MEVFRFLSFGGDSLISDTKEKNEPAFLCGFSAKQLYNLALHTVGDRHLAEQAVLSAFSDACRQLSDTSDVRLVEAQCLRLLYQYGKKAMSEAGEGRGVTSGHTLYGCIAPYKAETNRLARVLSGMSFSEKFILLLFCRHKYTVRQIAETTRLPVFLVERRLNAAADKAAREE
jgi:hypothetical protein